MRFIIKPDDPSLYTLLETAQYKRVWQQYGRKIRTALREITRLEFQQSVITARVCSGSGQSDSGTYRQPMRLAGDYRSEPEKLLTVLHELGHLLLSGNRLHVMDLGLYPERDGDEANDPEYIEKQHRLLYLFEYDVARRCLSPELAEACLRYERHKEPTIARAWQWAMSMTYEERQRAVKILAAQAVSRDRWRTVGLKPIAPVDSDTWFRQLNPKADPAVREPSDLL